MHRPLAFIVLSTLIAASCGSSSESTDSTQPVVTISPQGTTNPGAADGTQPSDSGTDTSSARPVEVMIAGPEGTLIGYTPSSSPSVAAHAYGMLGGWTGSAWSSYGQPETFSAPTNVGDSYTIVRMNGENTQTQVTEIGLVCDPLEAIGIITDPEIPAEWGGDSPIAVKADWSLQPHAAPTAGNPDPLYFEAVREFFATRGVNVGEIDITQFFRLDLEGDGVDEVVLSAKSSGLDPASSEFTYPAVSIVLLRKVINEEVKTWFLSNSIFTEADGASLDGAAPFIELFTISSFVDLNGDGRSEIVINDQSFEGAGTRVFEYINDSIGPKVVLNGGCGA